MAKRRARNLSGIVVLLTALLVSAFLARDYFNVTNEPRLASAPATAAHPFKLGRVDGVVMSDVCKSVHVAIDARTLPTTHRQALIDSTSKAVTTLASAGARVVFDGLTYNPDPSRTGQKDHAAVLIKFAQPGDPGLDEGTIGGTRNDTGYESPWQAAWIALEANYTLSSVHNGASVLVEHELSHALGLDHVDDPMSIMAPDLGQATAPGPGDLDAFKTLYASCS